MREKESDTLGARSQAATRRTQEALKLRYTEGKNRQRVPRQNVDEEEQDKL